MLSGISGVVYDSVNPTIIDPNGEIDLEYLIGVNRCYTQSGTNFYSTCSNKAPAKYLAGKDIYFSLEYDTDFFEENFDNPVNSNNQDFVQVGSWTNWACFLGSLYCEVGGKNKTFKQIKDLPHSFLACDDIEVIFCIDEIQ